jgi:hypothetical protein
MREYERSVIFRVGQILPYAQETGQSLCDASAQGVARHLQRGFLWSGQRKLEIATAREIKRMAVRSLPWDAATATPQWSG